MKGRLYRRSTDVLWRSVGREVLLTRPNAEITDVLSETGAMVWRRIERPQSPEDIARRLPESAGSVEEVTSRVEAALGVLVQRGYVEPDDR